jgi:transposase
MIKLRKDTKIYVSTELINMRKSIDGISVLVQECLGYNPHSGHLFIFFNKAKDKVKVLWWDKNGFVLHYKRLEKHRFVVPSLLDKKEWLIDELQLNGLLLGLDFTLMSEFDEVCYDQLF